MLGRGSTQNPSVDANLTPSPKSQASGSAVKSLFKPVFDTTVGTCVSEMSGLHETSGGALTGCQRRMSHDYRACDDVRCVSEVLDLYANSPEPNPKPNC